MSKPPRQQPASITWCDRWAEQHRDFLARVYERRQLDGVWPDADDLGRRGLREDWPFDTFELADELPPPIGSRRRGTENCITLRVRGLRHVKAASPLLIDFVRVIELIARTFVEAASKPVIGSEDIAALGLTGERITAISELLFTEYWMLGSGSGNFDAEWHRELHTSCRYLVDVTSLDDYLQAEGACVWSQSRIGWNPLIDSGVEELQHVPDEFVQSLRAESASDAAPPTPAHMSAPPTPPPPPDEPGPTDASHVSDGSPLSRTPSVFVSYAHEDAPTAHAFASGVEAKGFRVWLDDRELLAGGSLVEQISAAVAEIDVFCPLISEASRKSDWCQKELSLAMTRIGPDGALVMPLRLGNVEMPASVRDLVYVKIDPDDVSTAVERIANDVFRHRHQRQAAAPDRPTLFRYLDLDRPDTAYAYLTSTSERDSPEKPPPPETTMSIIETDGPFVRRVHAVPNNAVAVEQYGPVIRVETTADEKGAKAAALIQAALEHGQSVEISEGTEIVVENAPPALSALIGERLGGGTLELHPTKPPMPPPPPWHARLTVETPDGPVSIDIKLVPTDPPAGFDGALAGSFGGLTVTVRFRVVGDRGQIGWHMHYARDESPLADRVAALRLLRALSAEGEMTVTDRGGTRRPEMQATIKPTTLPEPLLALISYLEDLLTVSEWSGVTLDVPEVVDAEHAATIANVARMIRDGKWNVTWDRFELQVDRAALDKLQAGGQQVAAVQSLAARINGQEVDLGFGHIIVTEYAVEVLAELDDGRYEIAIAPPDGVSAETVQHLTRNQPEAEDDKRTASKPPPPAPRKAQAATKKKRGTGHGRRRRKN